MGSATPATPNLAVDRDLERLAAARNLGDWMFEQFAGDVRGTVVEVGAGIGTFSRRILDAGAERLLLVEPSGTCAPALHERFRDDPRVEIAQEELPGSPALAALAGQADLAVCQNVLEHIEDDFAAVRALAAALRPGGTLFLLMPAHPRLFGSLDRVYEHHRRYTPERLRALAADSGLACLDLYHFNLLGVPGWWLSNRRGEEELSSGALAAYEVLVRGWRRIERRRRPPAGLSLVLRAQRPRA
jgi:SAM-dependent methyltransferase